MRREIRRIEPWSAVRVGFFAGLVAGFIFGLLNGAIVKYLAGAMGTQMIPPDMMNVVNLSGGALIALALFTSLISSLMGAILGVFSAIMYNVIASMFGGLEITVIDDEPAKAAHPRQVADEDGESPHE